MSRRSGWDAARQAATELGRSRLPRDTPTGLQRALGAVLAAEVRAIAHVPAADVSAMDGWAVSGQGPWRLVPAQVQQLAGAEAAPVSTGMPVPRGAGAVVRLEHGQVDAGRLWAPEPVAGADVRAKGEEVRAGEVVLARGTVLTHARLGLAAAVGADSVRTVVAPRAVLLVTGDELVESGPPRPGRVRDSLSHVLPGMVGWLGADLDRVARCGDDAATLRDVFAGPYRSTVELVVTTGGTASGAADHVRRSLRDVGATLVADGIAARPGGPTLLAVVPDGPVVLALPGNPLAAVAGLMTLGTALLGGWLGVTDERLTEVRAPGVQPHPGATRLLPARLDLAAGTAAPTGHHGPGMLRGLAGATGLLVVDPSGLTRWLPLPT